MGRQTHRLAGNALINPIHLIEDQAGREQETRNHRIEADGHVCIYGRGHRMFLVGAVGPAVQKLERFISDGVLSA